MAKASTGTIFDINDIKNHKELLPLYILAGEDLLGIEKAAKYLEHRSEEFVQSDFDKAVFYGDTTSTSEVLSLTSSFPFSSDKKFYLYKDFDKARDRKEIIKYFSSPVDFTILVVLFPGKIDSKLEIYKKAKEAGYLFEAKIPKGIELAQWLVGQAELRKRKLSIANAQYIIEIIGDNRSMLEPQLEKIVTYIGEENEITPDAIKQIASSLKEYSIFDLQNALVANNKEKAMTIVLNLLSNGMVPVQITSMLIKFYNNMLRVKDITSQADANKDLGLYLPWMFESAKRDSEKFTIQRLNNAFDALIEAELDIKKYSAADDILLLKLIAKL